MALKTFVEKPSAEWTYVINLTHSYENEKDESSKN